MLKNLSLKKIQILAGSSDDLNLLEEIFNYIKDFFNSYNYLNDKKYKKYNAHINIFWNLTINGNTNTVLLDNLYSYWYNRHQPYYCEFLNERVLNHPNCSLKLKILHLLG